MEQVRRLMQDRESPLVISVGGDSPQLRAKRSGLSYQLGSSRHEALRLGRRGHPAGPGCSFVVSTSAGYSCLQALRWVAGTWEV